MWTGSQGAACARRRAMCNLFDDAEWVIAQPFLPLPEPLGDAASGNIGREAMQPVRPERQRRDAGHRRQRQRAIEMRE
jgi:hypothetical protein